MWRRDYGSVERWEDELVKATSGEGEGYKIVLATCWCDIAEAMGYNKSKARKGSLNANH